MAPLLIKHPLSARKSRASLIPMMSDFGGSGLERGFNFSEISPSIICLACPIVRAANGIASLRVISFIVVFVVVLRLYSG